MPKKIVTKYDKLVKRGIFNGSSEEYYNLSQEEKSRLNKIFEYIEDSYSINKKNVFNGTNDDFLKLSYSEQDKIIEMYEKDKKEQLKRSFKDLEYNSFKKQVPTYTGTFDDYLKLSDKEKNEITVNYLLNSYNKDKNNILKNIDDNYKKMKNCDDEYEFLLLKQQYEDNFTELEKLNSDRLKLIDMLKNANIPIPNDIILLLDTNISKPKFGFFDNKKYKLLDSLLIDEYIYKLKTRQIDSNFQKEEDYNDKSKWKEYIDIKEREYQQLHNQNPSIYLGSFEEYLQESTIVTFEYLKFGISSTKIIENASKLRKQQELENQKRIEDANRIFEIRANSNAELNAIMNGPAAKKLAQHSASALSEILDDIEKQKKSSPYSYKPGSKIQEEDKYDDNMSVDEILRRNANRR